MRPEELCQRKIQVTPSGIEPATFRLCLSQLGHRLPLQVLLLISNSDSIYEHKRCCWVGSIPTSSREVYCTVTRYNFFATGGLVYAVNGPTSSQIPVRGFTLDPLSGTALDRWGPAAVSIDTTQRSKLDSLKLQM